MADFLARRCTRQPQGLAEIDWGNPLIRNPLFLHSTHIKHLISRDFVGNFASNYDGYGTEIYGSRYGPIRSGLSYGDFERFKPFNSANPFTFFILRPVVDTGSAHRAYIADLFDNDTYDPCFTLQISQNNTANCLIDVYATGGVDSDSVEFYAPTGVRFICFTKLNNTLSVYVDGALAGQNTNATRSIAMDSQILYSDYSDFLVGLLGCGLSGPEVQALSLNPWQIFKPRRSVIYSFPSGGITIPTLSLPGVQDITATGARPKVTLTF